ncbi:ABC transporter substrate-binding protein [Roseospira visakhapatnamensis]|uniref:Iron complex transport system substrate-binding protein n=1 Tax=Roseospira visakhapatnamensis TaxID=390880 RepID=A0A7W6RDD2_9PROT|nr:ABC transporter substrate-binding protein [Roseospira visakhapatnamensis]MBB4266501.1 iron complex transport system substrate-binding protein [Roseospira visakhapatnamensis]
MITRRRRPIHATMLAGGLVAGLVTPWTAAVAGAGVGAADGRPLPRVASATLCGDQYVLALADPEQIVALSPHATKPWLSLLADQAATYPRLRPSAEGYLHAGVDMVITNAWTDHATAALLERFGVTVARIPLEDDIDRIAALTRDIGRALGHPARGDALADTLLARIAAARAAAPGRDRVALYLRPGGGTAAEGAYVATLMDAVGLRNQATEAGLSGWSSWSLEQVIADPPDLLVTSFFDSPHAGMGQAFGDHPAFTTRAATIDRIEVPGAAWVCGGWILAEAVEALTEGLEALNAREAHP